MISWFGITNGSHQPVLVALMDDCIAENPLRPLRNVCSSMSAATQANQMNHLLTELSLDCVFKNSLAITTFAEAIAMAMLSAQLCSMAELPSKSSRCLNASQRSD